VTQRERGDLVEETEVLVVRTPNAIIRRRPLPVLLLFGTSLFEYSDIAISDETWMTMFAASVLFGEMSRKSNIGALPRIRVPMPFGTVDIFERLIPFLERIIRGSTGWEELAPANWQEPIVWLFVASFYGWDDATVRLVEIVTSIIPAITRKHLCQLLGAPLQCCEEDSGPSLPGALVGLEHGDSDGELRTGKVLRRGI
jgi:hypothetical protein